MWGNELPIGTHMMSDKTYKVYVWDGKQWNPNVTFKKVKELKYSLSLSMYQDNELNDFDSPPLEDVKKIKLKIKKPCMYNLFVQKMMLSKKYNHLSIQDRMRAIAKDWKNSTSVNLKSDENL